MTKHSLITLTAAGLAPVQLSGLARTHRAAERAHVATIAERGVRIGDRFGHGGEANPPHPWSFR